MSPREERVLVSSDVRAEANGRKVSGHASLFDTLSVDLGGFRELIKPGAFRNALKGTPDVIFNFNHNNDYILGRTTAGTLHLREDSKGLSFESELPDTQLINDMVLSPMRRGELRGTSFAFSIAPSGQTWSMDTNGGRLRTITQMAQVFDVTLCSRPAYSEASASLRGVRSPAEVLREAGMESDWNLALEYRRLQLEAMTIGLRLPNETPTPEQFRSLQLKVRKLRILQV